MELRGHAGDFLLWLSRGYCACNATLSRRPCERGRPRNLSGLMAVMTPLILSLRMVARRSTLPDDPYYESHIIVHVRPLLYLPCTKYLPRMYLRYGGVIIPFMTLFLRLRIEDEARDTSQQDGHTMPRNMILIIIYHPLFAPCYETTLNAGGTSLNLTNSSTSNAVGVFEFVIV
ncbi:hypothetical protein BKA93DRAFT_89942 [Sparassis latifolia]